MKAKLQRAVAFLAFCVKSEDRAETLFHGLSDILNMTPGFWRVRTLELIAGSFPVLNALGAGGGIVVGTLDGSFTRKEPAMLLVHFDPVLLLAVYIAVGHQVAVAAALEILLGICVLLDSFSHLPQTIVSFFLLSNL